MSAEEVRQLIVELLLQTCWLDYKYVFMIFAYKSEWLQDNINK